MDPRIWLAIVVIAGTLWILSLVKLGMTGELVSFDPDSDGLRFKERKASGWSHDRALGNLRGAARSLVVTVTPREIGLQLDGMFRALGSLEEAAGLPETVPKDSITKITGDKRGLKSASGRVFIHFGEGGKSRRCELQLEHRDKFLQALALPQLHGEYEI